MATTEQRIESTGGPLNEEALKLLGLRYLKSYYRFTPRTDDIRVYTDQYAEGGLIMDGLLQFHQPDGELFTASLEATSEAKQREIRYRIHEELIWWDGFATIATLATIVVGYLHIEGIYLISYLTFWGAVLAVLGAIFLCAGLFYAIMRRRPLRRYRYIYAIEQFKNYFANDQWVIFAETVFENYQPPANNMIPEDEGKYNNPYYEELKQQCINNGFGLIEVTREHRVQLLAAPARNSEAGDRQRIIRFLSESELGRGFEQMKFTSLGQVLYRRLPWIARRADLTNLMRFRKTFYKQVVLVLTTLPLWLFLLYREIELARPVILADEAYIDELLALKRRRQVHQAYIPMDDPYILPFEPKTKPYLAVMDSNLRTPDALYPVQPGFYIMLQEEGLVRYDCERFFTFRNDKYMVIARRTKDINQMRQDLQDLNRYKLESGALAMNCLDFDKEYYVVFTGELYNTFEEAQIAARQWRRSLATTDLRFDLRIEQIRPVR